MLRDGSTGTHATEYAGTPAATATLWCLTLTGNKLRLGNNGLESNRMRVPLMITDMLL